MLKHSLPNLARIIAVLKADAYGHCLSHITALIRSNPMVCMVAVAQASEAFYVRQLLPEMPILLLVPGYDVNEYRRFFQHAITPAIHAFEQVALVREAVQHSATTASLHLKVDTGLSRLGILPERIQEVVTELGALSQVKVTGIFTHLADPDNSDTSFTKQQLERFVQTARQVEALLFRPLLRHALASGGIPFWSVEYPVVRVGGLLYGMHRSNEHEERMRKRYPQWHAKPVLSWFTRLIQVVKIPAGTRVGYGSTFITQRPTLLGTIPIGYFDGLPRAATGWHVEILGKKAPLIGRVSMNLMVIDVTDIPDVACGDEVTIFGGSPGHSISHFAEYVNTVDREIATRIASHIPRIMVGRQQ
jgi:alanine racemase